MKQFIVLLAVIPMMLFFLAQLTLEAKNSQNIAMMTDIVYAAKEEAKQQGGFDSEAIRKELSLNLGVREEDIIIEAPEVGTVPRIDSDGKRGIIEYRIVVPVEGSDAAARYLGIKDGARRGYEIKSASPSEYLRVR